MSATKHVAELGQFCPVPGTRLAESEIVAGLILKQLEEHGPRLAPEVRQELTAAAARGPEAYIKAVQRLGGAFENSDLSRPSCAVAEQEHRRRLREIFFRGPS